MGCQKENKKRGVSGSQNRDGKLRGLLNSDRFARVGYVGAGTLTFVCVVSMDCSCVGANRWLFGCGLPTTKWAAYTGYLKSKTKQMGTSGQLKM